MPDFYWFGGGPGLRTSDCYLVDDTGARVADAPAVVKDAGTGTTLTDLLNDVGTPVTEITSGALGYLTFAARVPVVDVTSGSLTFRFTSSTAVESVVAIAPTVDALATSAATAATSASAAQLAAEAAAAAAVGLLAVDGGVL